MLFNSDKITNDAIPRPNCTHTQRGKYVVHDTLTHRQSLKYCYKLINYCHRIHCVSLTQVTPGHVSEILAMNTERIKSENPELKRYYYFVSNGLIVFHFVYYNIRFSNFNDSILMNY